MNKKRRESILIKIRGIISTVITILILFLIFSSTIVNFVTDYLWFKDIGFDEVFLTKLMTQLKTGIPIFIILTAVIYLYLQSIKKDYYKKVDSGVISISEKRINQVTLVGSVIVSLMASSAFAGGTWYELLRFFNSTSFNVMDPLFNNDVSFYIFKLPFIEKLYYLLSGFVFMMAVLTLVFYMFMMSVRRPTIFDINREPQQVGRKPIRIDYDTIKSLIHIAFRQLTVLAVIFFLIQAVGSFLKTYSILYSQNGVVYGAGFTDVHVSLWLYRVMMVVSVVSAILLLIGAKTKNIRLALTGPVLMIAISILGNLAAAGVQNFIVSPNEISREAPYLEENIKYTKLAYGLDDIEEREFPAEENLTREDLEANKETIDNIRVNDYRPTTQFYNQRQGIRLYYRFNDVDIDRYMIDGKYTQVFLGAREIDYTKINPQWINQHLKYTHGYGVALSPVNSVTSEGQPNLLIRDIPPKSYVDSIKVDEPRVYYGELTNNYVITNTREMEFDYPSGDANVENIYDGEGGIKLNGINRLLFAIKERSLRMLISGDINAESKILLYRNINERVNKIAPFLDYDEDPYLVINEGKLYWILDAYTVSGNFPYAEPYMTDNRNYIRNSVKVVIDAYNGDVTYYAVDDTDPLLKTIDKVFPQLLTPMDEMPEGLKAHIRYPLALFNIQSEVYRVYHMTDVEVFYQEEDLWDISNEIYENSQQQMEPNYFIMKLPNEEKEEFVLSIPYTPRGKPNMTALFVARNDGENYGKLTIFKLPKQKNIYGPMQIESRIDQDTEISKEFSLWGQQGSSYIRGNVLTIPIEDSLIYVEPVYLRAANENSLPEVKRVIVAYGDRIAYEETLDEALISLFGETEEEEELPEVPMEGDMPDNMRDLINRANDIFNSAQEAQRAGNWGVYGDNINELQRILERLNQLNNPAPVEE